MEWRTREAILANLPLSNSSSYAISIATGASPSLGRGWGVQEANSVFLSSFKQEQRWELKCQEGLSAEEVRRAPFTLSPSVGPLESQEKSPGPVQGILVHGPILPPQNPASGSPDSEDLIRKAWQGHRVERTFGVRRALSPSSSSTYWWCDLGQVTNLPEPQPPHL